jgi:hypothetical protein
MEREFRERQNGVKSLAHTVGRASLRADHADGHDRQEWLAFPRRERLGMPSHSVGRRLARTLALPLSDGITLHWHSIAYGEEPEIAAKFCFSRSKKAPINCLAVSTEPSQNTLQRIHSFDRWKASEVRIITIDN